MARWTAAKSPAIFAYSTNIMIDVENAIIMDVEATPGFRSDEVESTKTLLERIETKHQIKPKRLMGIPLMALPICWVTWSMKKVLSLTFRFGANQNERMVLIQL